MQTHYSKKDVLFSILAIAAGMQAGLIPVLRAISADNVEALILSAIKRFSRFVLNDEKALLWNCNPFGKISKRKSRSTINQVKRCQKRYDELSTLHSWLVV